MHPCFESKAARFEERTTGHPYTIYSSGTADTFEVRYDHPTGTPVFFRLPGVYIIPYLFTPDSRHLKTGKYP